MKPTINFRERVIIFNKKSLPIKDYVFYSSELIPSLINDEYFIKERKHNVSTLVLDVSELTDDRKYLHSFYFLLSEIVLSFLRCQENEVVINSPSTPMSFIVFREHKELWNNLYKKLHNKSMSHLYVMDF